MPFGLGGDVASIIHGVEDVTEKHHIEEERQLFAALVEDSPNFVGLRPGQFRAPQRTRDAFWCRCMAGRPMSVAHPSRMEARVDILFQNTIVRYLFAIAIVASTFALRIWLIPFTGTGAPFVLFFAAVLVTSLLAGVGPGICALLISLPLAAYTFVTRAGYPPFQAAFQALLFAIDGIVVIYLTFLMKKGRQAAQDANRQLRGANEEIARSMARTREVIELAPDAFFQADLDARFTDVNQAACRMLGYDRDELIGKTIFDIIPAEDVPRLEAVRAELLVPGHGEQGRVDADAEGWHAVPVEVSSKILPDGRWQAFVRDISERKRIERALQESEERFRLTIDEAPIGMALVALDGRFVRVNRALCEIVGYSSDELTGLTFQAITHPDDLDADLALAGQLARGEIPRYQLGEALHPQGRDDRRYPAQRVDSSCAEMAPLYYIAQIEDITERKRTEEGATPIGVPVSGADRTHARRRVCLSRWAHRLHQRRLPPFAGT